MIKSSCTATFVCILIIGMCTDLHSQYRKLWDERLYLQDSIGFGIYVQGLDGNLIGNSGRWGAGQTKVLVSRDFFRSIDTTVAAQMLPDGQFNTNIVTDAQGILWRGDNSTRVWKSSDGGVRWVLVADFESLYGLGGGLKQMHIDHAGVLYAFYKASDVLRSTDKGISWVYVDHPAGGDKWCSMEVASSGDLFTLLFHGTENAMLYRSIDMGASWSRLDTLLQVEREYGLYKPEIDAADFRLIDDIPYLCLVHQTRNDGTIKGFRWVYMFKPRSDWKGMDTVCEEDLMFRNVFVDPGGTWHGSLTDNRPGLPPRLSTGYGISTDKGRSWKMMTANRGSGDLSPHDTLDPYTGDTLQTIYGAGADPLWLMPNGHVLWSTTGWGYNLSTFRIPTPPMAIGVERACNTYTVTFVSDSLLSVEVSSPEALYTRVEIDTLRKGVSSRVRISSTNQDTTVRFVIRAKGAMGTTVYRDSLVKHYIPTFRVSGDSIHVDAGKHACYSWFYNDSALWFNIQPSIKMKGEGNYWCDVFDSTSCRHQKVAFTQFRRTDVAENSSIQGELRLAPLPAASYIEVAHTDITDGTLEIHDLLGTCLLVCPCETRESTTLNLEHLADGLYTVNLRSGNKIRTRVFAIVR